MQVNNTQALKAKWCLKPNILPTHKLEKKKPKKYKSILPKSKENFFSHFLPFFSQHSYNSLLTFFLFLIPTYIKSYFNHLTANP